MKKAGFFKDEIYTLKSPNDKKARLAICDMDGVDGYENNEAVESNIGYVNHLPTSELTVFSAYSNAVITIAVGDYLHYDHFYVSSNTFDLKSGTFKAPFRGIYEFSITDHNYNNGNYFSLNVEKNGSQVYSVHDWHGQSAAHLSSSWILSLEVNDEIRVQVEFHPAYSDDNCYRSFTGKLLEML